MPEHVAALPGDIPVERIQGPPGFGAFMAWVDGELAVGGGGVVRWAGEEWEVPALRGLWAGPDGPRAATDAGVLDLALEASVYEGPVVAGRGQGARLVVASEGELIVDGVNQELAGVRGIRVGSGGILLLRCAGPACWVELDGVQLGASEEGAALAWQGERPLWGAPDLAEELGEGRVLDPEGVVLRGEAAEHLGQGICSDFAVGEHNLHARPNQSRIRSLNGTGEVAIGTGHEGGAVVLACDAQHLAMAQPTWLEGGRIWVVDRGDLP